MSDSWSNYLVEDGNVIRQGRPEHGIRFVRPSATNSMGAIVLIGAAIERQKTKITGGSYPLHDAKVAVDRVANGTSVLKQMRDVQNSFGKDMA